MIELGIALGFMFGIVFSYTLLSIRLLKEERKQNK